ncbi:MAG: methylenetetrahydrofolate--tRNA-(uracil(54)-C(5))-methyltransferase (FADH(2)-oxidizing) TrmFO [Alphaproteobacteria bacterium]|nr:methylenetetrahydrofolate--tRNA-(uracil(54)-C(5))-methyltransferase (FADH(2)-oxidizing) TrmFO [Alphaproteobacteria bacterium]
MIHSPVHIIGAGLAGSEAAWTVAQAGVPVVLHEMRPHRLTPAHKTDGFAELVCSNSFRSDDWRANAVGLLHEELRRMGSIIMRCGDDNQVPAGGALAVDRDHFSAAVTRAVSTHPLITTAREEITALPPASWDSVIVATGPLTGPDLAQAIQDLTGEGELAFFDAIAPIVHRHSIDFDTAWMQSRYDKPGPAGEKAAYVNCPLNKAQYEAFVAALLEAPKTEFKDWEKDTPYFEGCLPIEVMAARGLDTLRFGPMKPVGLTDPRTGKGPYAVAQLRQDNALGTLFNMVGFQTKLKHSAQADLLRMIPGLEQAVFARLGGIHRNTFLNSPKLLNPTLQLKAQPRLRFAGQITGCEGYVESAAIGLLAGLFAARERLGLTISLPPQTTALGALLAHVTGGHLTGGDLMGGELMGGELMGDAPIGRRATSGGTFQPMNINFGLFPPLEDDTPPRGPNGKRLRGADKARARKAGLSDRALADLDRWRAAL